MTSSPRVDLIRRAEFSAGRQLAISGAAEEENRRIFGRAARVHGHDFGVEITLRGGVDPLTGMLVNFEELKGELRALALGELHESRLDTDVEELRQRPATVENLARLLRRRLERARWQAEGAVLFRVRVSLDHRTHVDDLGGPEMHLTRRYHFAASHRLFSPSLDPDENRRIFGKCANPNGHGHNYLLEVTVAGEPDERTGLVLRAGALDSVVEERVLDLIDHTYLNLDHPELFGDRVPTAENICVVIWRLLAGHVGGLPCRLVRLRLEETRDCFVEYQGPEEAA